MASTHPSQPNYIASTSGWTANVTSDSTFDVDCTSIVDLMEAKDVSWKAYMEDLPENDKRTTSYDGKYYRKHNPFVSYDNVYNNPDWLAKVVNADDDSQGLQADLKNGTFPQYAWYTPNIYNDGHSTQSGFHPCSTTSSEVSQLIQQISCWTAWFMDTYAQQLPEGTLIVLTFDEDYPYTSNPDDDNHIYTVLLGDAIGDLAGQEIQDRYDHYSLLATAEHNFDLGNLNRNDAVAQYFRFLWNEPYSNGAVQWGSQMATGAITFPEIGQTALVEFNGTAYLFYPNSQQGGLIQYLTYTVEGGWSDTPNGITVDDSPLATGGALAGASYNGQLMLIYVSTSGSGHMHYTTFDGTNWSSPHHVSDGDDLSTGGPVTLAPQNGDLYLIYVSDSNDGHMHFTYWNGSSWADEHHVQNYHTSALTTDGDFSACHYGELTLVYQGHQTTDMYWVQYDGISDNQFTYDLSSGHETGGTIAVASANSKMWVIFQSPSSLNLHLNIFQDGAFAPSSLEFKIDGIQVTTDGPVAVTPLGDDQLLVVWKGTGANTLYASLGTLS